MVLQTFLKMKGLKPRKIVEVLVACLLILIVIPLKIYNWHQDKKSYRKIKR